MQHDFNISTGALESHALTDLALKDARIGDFLVEICKTGGPMEVALAFLVREKKIAAAVSLILIFFDLVLNMYYSVNE